MSYPDPEIILLPKRKLVGVSREMSYVENRTFELWRSFMPRRIEVAHVAGSTLYSVQQFNRDHFANFSPANIFRKWAAVEVTNIDWLPEGMETLIIPQGLYAVFHYRGRSTEGQKIFQYIFSQWLPSSGYVLDDRPHFEMLGDKYKNDDPESEEDICIPVRQFHASS